MSFPKSPRRNSPLRRPRKAPSPAPACSPAPPEPGERLQKFLARSGLGSRRHLEALIAQGRVQVNGQRAQLGQRVGATDRVTLNGRAVASRRAPRAPRLLLYHKKAGEIVSRDDPAGRPSVFERLPALRGARWIAVGRLDFNTSGLLLFSDSGDLAHRLMHPSFGMMRQYMVRVLGELSDAQKALLLKGVPLEDGPARFEHLEDAGGRGTNRWYRVALCEGRNREVRRMFEVIGVTVSRLMRIAFGRIELPRSLRQGRCRELSSAEIARLLDP